MEFSRRHLDVAAQWPFVAGTRAWRFADFKTGQGTTRAAATSHKGAATRDCRPKTAAHFLRSRRAEA